MNFKFGTGAERIAVLEDLRKPNVIFPPSWDSQLHKQKESTFRLFNQRYAEHKIEILCNQSSLGSYSISRRNAPLQLSFHRVRFFLRAWKMIITRMLFV